MVLVGDIIPHLLFGYEIYKDGSNYVAIDGSNSQVKYVNTNFATLYNSVKADVGTTGKIIAFREGTYQTDSTLVHTTSHSTPRIMGLGNRFRVILEALGDYPVFEFQGTTYSELSNLGFHNNQATKTTPFINIKDVTVWSVFDNLYMINNDGTDKGIGIQFEALTTGQIAYNQFHKLTTRNLNIAYKVKSDTSTTDGVWVNDNFFNHCRDFNSLQFLKLQQKTGTTSQDGHFDQNVFNACSIQADSVSNNIFDLDDGAFSSIDIGGGTVIWDQTVASPVSIKLGTRSNVILGTTRNVLGKLGGSGFNNGAKLSKSDWQRSLFGEYTTTVTDSTQTDYVITHNLTYHTPNRYRVWAGSIDAHNAGTVSVIPSSVTSTQMTVRFARPVRLPNPSTVTNNLKLFWEVEYI